MAATPISFGVTSFNILHPDYAYPSRYPHCKEMKINAVSFTPLEANTVSFTPLDWDYRFVRICNILREAKSEIICLQEVDLLKRESFIAKFTDYEIVFQDQKRKLKEIQKWINTGSESNSRKPNTCVVATMVLKSKFEILESVAKSRSLTTLIQDKETGKKLGVTNIHLEANTANTADTKELDSQHVQHLESIQRFLHERPMPQLICGDFNNFPNTPPLQYLTDSGYTRYVSGSITQATFMHFDRHESIDHLFTTKEMKVVSVVLSDIKKLPIPNEDHPSDHIALTYSIIY